MIKSALNERERETILAYAANNMSMKKTAERMFYAIGTIQWHIAKVKEKTGLDPRKFYDLVKLVSELKTVE